MVALHDVDEEHVRQMVPLVSRSRALLAFHARRKHYPEGNIDKVRLIQNPDVPGNILETLFPVLESSNAPVLVNRRNAREARVNAWIDGDKELDDRDATVATFSMSIKCGFAEGVVVDDLPSFPGIRVPCDDAYETCILAPGTTTIKKFYNKNITRIPACMRKYKNLKTLVLEDTKVSRIENLDANVNLKKLWLTDTKVSRIENLDTNVKLEYIWLSRTPVNRIENLDTNVKLKTLGLGGTKVSTIENLEKNVNLKSLDLTGTKVSRIENLDKNTKLEGLRLSGTTVPTSEKQAFKASRPGLRVY